MPAAHRPTNSACETAGGATLNKGEAVSGKPLVVTAAAAEKIKAFAEKEGKPACLRVSVVEGGCAGYTTKLALDEKRAGDTVVERDGARVFLDEKALGFFRGATLDYADSLMKSGFQLGSPHAKASCDCGHSFK